MEWFSEGVVNAIAACRRQSALFVVFVADDSESSSATEASWNSSEVLETLSDITCVGLKIMKDSLEYHQFSQLYPVFVFPSVFCIGVTGKPLVIMNGQQSTLQLRDKLTQAFQLLQKEMGGGSATTSSSDSRGKEVDQEPLPSKDGADTQTGEGEGSSPSEQDEGAVNTSPGVAGGGGGGRGQEEETVEEKLEKYQEKRQQRRQERAAEEAEREKQREHSRRQMGREMSQLRKTQDDQRNQNWLQERKKQKEEEQRAREEIRAKLKQDQLERQAQQSSSKGGAVRQRASASPTGLSAASTSGTCRIQLRLPHGGLAVLEVNKADTLTNLREAAAKELNEQASAIVLIGVYPRRELGPELDSHSLEELQLAPSGVVIVKLKKDMVSVKHGGGGVGQSLLSSFMSVLQLIVGFLTFLKNAISGLFWSSGPQQGARGSDQLPRRHYGSDNSSAASRMKKFRQEDFQDDDDEEKKNTYNGNSTQQQ